MCLFAPRKICSFNTDMVFLKGFRTQRYRSRVTSIQDTKWVVTDIQVIRVLDIKIARSCRFGSLFGLALFRFNC